MSCRKHRLRARGDLTDVAKGVVKYIDHGSDHSGSSSSSASSSENDDDDKPIPRQPSTEEKLKQEFTVEDYEARANLVYGAYKKIKDNAPQQHGHQGITVLPPPDEHRPNKALLIPSEMLQKRAAVRRTQKEVDASLSGKTKKFVVKRYVCGVEFSAAMEVATEFVDTSNRNAHKFLVQLDKAAQQLFYLPGTERGYQLQWFDGKDYVAAYAESVAKNNELWFNFMTAVTKDGSNVIFI